MTKQTQSKKESAKPAEEKPRDNTDVLLRIEALLGKTIEACNEVRDSVDRLAKKFSGGY